MKKVFSMVLVKFICHVRTAHKFVKGPVADACYCDFEFSTWILCQEIAIKILLDLLVNKARNIALFFDQD